MLSAWNQPGEAVLAEEVELADDPFYCPAYRDQLVLKKGRKVVAHFAHRPDTECEYTNEGESEEHRLTKLEIYWALLHVPGVTNVRLERYLRQVRPDVSFVVNGQLVAIEIQLSLLSCEKIEWRTKAYARKNIAVLWMPSFSAEVARKAMKQNDWKWRSFGAARAFVHRLGCSSRSQWRLAVLPVWREAQRYSFDPGTHIYENSSVTAK